MKRRWLADKVDNKVYSYFIDDESKQVHMPINVDPFELRKHGQQVKSGFDSIQQAQRWLNGVTK